MAIDINAAKDAANAVKEVADPIIKAGKVTAKSSLTRLTKDQVFQFPIIMDADINDDEKFPIIKSIEKNYASLILTAITNEGYIDRGKVDDINKFLRKFHNNNDIPFDSMESIMVTDAIATEGYLPEGELAEMWDSVEEQLDTSSINNMYLPYRKTATKLHNALEAARLSFAMEASEPEKRYFSRVKYKTDKNGKIEKFDGKPMVETDKNGNPVMDYFEAPDQGTRKYDDMVKRYGEPKTIKEYGANAERQRAEIEKEIRGQKYDLDKENRRQKYEMEKENRKNKIDAAKGIRGDIVKDDKFNNLTPTLLKISLANYKGGTAWNQELIIGVRAMPRMLSQSIIISNMVEAFKDRAVFKFIKWTRGEIKWKDIFFGVGKARDDASMKADRKWLKVLRKRSKRANLGRLGGYKLNPNCTVIITEADAHMIQEKCGINVHDVSNVRKMMDKYFLLAFGVYDTEAKMLNIIYDGETEYSTYSLRTLMADVKKESNLLAMNRY